MRERPHAHGTHSNTPHRTRTNNTNARPHERHNVREKQNRIIDIFRKFFGVRHLIDRLTALIPVLEYRHISLIN